MSSYQYNSKGGQPRSIGNGYKKTGSAYSNASNYFSADGSGYGGGGGYGYGFVGGSMATGTNDQFWSGSNGDDSGYNFDGGYGSYNSGGGQMRSGGCKILRYGNGVQICECTVVPPSQSETHFW